jgi:hypothetical protein
MFWFVVWLHSLSILLGRFCHIFCILDTVCCWGVYRFLRYSRFHSEYIYSFTYHNQSLLQRLYNHSNLSTILMHDPNHAVHVTFINLIACNNMYIHSAFTNIFQSHKQLLLKRQLELPTTINMLNNEHAIQYLKHFFKNNPLNTRYPTKPFNRITYQRLKLQPNTNYKTINITTYCSFARSLMLFPGLGFMFVLGLIVISH